jgi:catalase
VSKSLDTCRRRVEMSTLSPALAISAESKLFLNFDHLPRSRRKPDFGRSNALLCSMEGNPVNKPQCPVHTYNRDGFMCFDENSGSEVNYEPNSFNGPTEDPAYRERLRTITGSVDRHNHRLDSDYYTQPGNLFCLMAPGARERLIGNSVASMESVAQRIQELQIQHFYKADPAYGTGVAKGLGLNCNESNSTQFNAAAAYT